MILTLAYCSRIVPLTRTVWNAAFGEQTTMREIDIWVYSKPSKWIEGDGIGGRLLEDKEVSDKHGQFFRTSFAHAFMKDKTFLELMRNRNRGQEFGQFEYNAVRFELCEDDQLLIQVYDRRDQLVWYETTMPFDAEDAPVVQWMKPMNDQVFVDTVLEFGKGFMRDGRRRQFRFEDVGELFPGVVFTRDGEQGDAHVFVDLGPWGEKIRPEQFPYPSEVLPNNVLRFEVGTVDRFDPDSIIEKLVVEFGSALKLPRTNNEHWLPYPWQQRVDLLPENW